MDVRGFNDQAHPHVPAGSSSGGQFAPTDSGGSGGKQPPKKTGQHTGTMAYDPHSKTGPGYNTAHGDKRVHQLQQALNRLGVKDGDGKALKDDGKLGPKTTAAVKKAQKALGVTADGKVTPELLAKLTVLKAMPHRSVDVDDIFLRAGAEMRADKTPYGDVPYADPGYQSDGKKRYPLDTYDHVKAAWSYINQAGNASQYTAEQLSSIKARIKAAAKKFGIEISDGRSYGYEMKEGATMAAVERRFTNVTVEMRTGDGPPRIGGYAAKFGQVSQNLGGFVEVVERSFFNKSRGDGWPSVMCRYNHDDNMLLGTSDARTLQLSIDETGLDYQVIPPTSRADVVELVQRGDVRKSSFAFRLPAEGDEWTMSDQGYPLRKLHTGQLVDVAPVNAPAYIETSVGLRSLDPAEIRRLSLGPQAAYESLARRMDADVDEVRAAADVNELHRFFRLVSGAPMPGPKPKPRTFGAAAMVALMQKKEDPWG